MAYLVDANNGRSSTAVALNSAFRGTFAFVATEITVPLQVCTAFWCYEIFSYTFISRMLWATVCIFSKKKVSRNVLRKLFVGWLYTIWAGLVLLSGSFTMIVWWKGGQWREAAEAKETEYAR